MDENLEIIQTEKDLLENDPIIDLLKKLVDEAIRYNQQQSELIKEYLEKKILKGKFVFRFPFILTEKHVNSFNECIERRLKTVYEEYEVKLVSLVEYKNNDKLVYVGIKDFFEATHDETMLRVHLNWEYKVKEEINGIAVPIKYDIIIFYEIEQDSDQRELFKLEEWGAIHVEGSNNDWINSTLSELKTLTKSAKMPFWWYYPKKAFLAMRDYTSILVWAIVFAAIVAFVIPLFFDTDSINMQFVEQARQISDASEKLQAYIEHALAPSNNNNLILFFFIIIGLSGVFTLLLTKASRYMFPKSMILIGNTKAKQRNILIAYSFIWGAILTAIIGIILITII